MEVEMVGAWWRDWRVWRRGSWVGGRRDGAMERGVGRVVVGRGGRVVGAGEGGCRRDSQVWRSVWRLCGEVSFGRVLG